MVNIAIIGAGQLGSRHLQALNQVATKLYITVIDPNPDSLDNARARFAAAIGQVNHEISYQTTFNAMQALDIAIIASTAQSRCQIIKTLLGHTTVKHLVLEKLLFTQEKDYDEVSNLLARHKIAAWVNCPMRMMPFYKTLNQLFKQQSIHYRVTGSQYGLVTNAIHYLDHIAYITGHTEFSLDTSYLDQQIIASKRPGYFELTGTLIARFKDNSIAFLHCDKNGNAPAQVEIYSNKQRIISREWQQQAWQTGIAQDWQWQEQAAAIPFQSTLTAELVSNLLQTNQCPLSDYQTSMQLHLQLLNPLKAFIDQQGIANELDYPFT